MIELDVNIEYNVSVSATDNDNSVNNDEIDLSDDECDICDDNTCETKHEKEQEEHR